MLREAAARVHCPLYCFLALRSPVQTESVPQSVPTCTGRACFLSSQKLFGDCI